MALRLAPQLIRRCSVYCTPQLRLIAKRAYSIKQRVPAIPVMTTTPSKGFFTASSRLRHLFWFTFLFSYFITFITYPSHSTNHGKEIKDTKLIFNQAWKNIEDHYGRENLHLPRELIFLMGAPGSGKGTHTPSILRARGITNPPISVSNLLDTPECKELINRGQMISDRTVMEMLFHALLDCDPTVGVLVDGFPRTEIQVEALRLFYDKMVELRREFWNTDRRDQFPRPVFRICVLYVDEDISVQRQLARGQMIREHNAQVRRSGQGVLWEERVTDFDETLIRSRYAIFKAHYGALLKLSKIFPFHLINAVGNINEVMQIILKEFEYQSSLELESDTYDAISHIPLANKIGVHARQASTTIAAHLQRFPHFLIYNFFLSTCSTSPGTYQ
ncbi:hypothetical protein INT44_000521 [Umbelopsis vinacea]|uniref:Adenylate kinase n=1 Tax=Umbelopsis vinacea TaxID=44442 RepID=A0A8H7PL45_9FUNG|nr:hypothetical protein INT44_000521 [Umbelopsis vinacea]